MSAPGGKAAEGKGADDEPTHRAGAGAGVGAGSGGNGGASMHTAEATALKFANAGDLLEIVEKQEKLEHLNINQTNLTRLPKTVVRRLDGLRLLDEEYTRIHRRLVAERRQLEEKYFKRFMPLLMQRTEIVNKRLDPSDIDIKAEDTSGLPIKLPPAPVKDQDEADSSDDDVPGTRGVPGFWLQAMSNNEVISQLITQRDEAALAHLVDIRTENLPGMQGFKIVFHFAPNRYFTNSELVKTFYIPNMLDGSEPMLERVEGTPVKWKRGQNLSVVAVKEKSRAKEGGRRKNVTRIKQCESFFNIFSGPMLSGTGANEHDDHEELLNQIDADFEIGLTFRDKIIPRAFAWYTGEAAEDSSEGEYSDEDEEAEDAFRNMFSSGPHAVSNVNDPGSSEEEEVTREEIRLALAEAFKSKIPAERPPQAHNTGDSTERTAASEADEGAIERPDECKTQ